MKKLLLVLIAVVGMSFAANAQSALGIRAGGGQGFGAELSYQQALGGFNRLEFDLGYHNVQEIAHLGLIAVYQAHFNFNAKGLGWYLGIGGRADLITKPETKFWVGAVGQAGLDYYFQSIPLQLSLDIRPCFYLVPSTEFHWGDIALGIRYVF